LTTYTTADVLDVVARLLNDINNIVARIFNHVNSDELDQELEEKTINTDVSIELCIELGSGT
jgi:ethanolamine utilization cobalamin adenosyltransferase